MVEEAGQVLEAHILASLVPSGTSKSPQCDSKVQLIPIQSSISFVSVIPSSCAQMYRRSVSQQFFLVLQS